MEAITAVVSDGEAADRLTCTHTTYDRFEGGETVEFRASLDDLLEASIVQACCKWLGRKSEEASTPVTLKHATGTPVSCLDRMVTDVGAAIEFGEAVKDRLIFADGQKQWFASNNHVFEPVTHERVMGLGMDFVIEIAAEANSVTFLP